MKRESKIKIERLETIYHIADIHIRNYKRHEEYKRVFQNLYEHLKCNNNESSLICVLGDVVHSKTDVTPELFHEVHCFLKELSEIAPVLLIPGNHDANLSNSSRMDALTPIVEALEGCNIDYVKDTCHFKIGGVQFTHWSVFDTKDKYYFPEDLHLQKRTICLFHGPVDSATTDTGFKFNNTSMDRPTFGRHDITLLGDIHKFQYIDENKTIAYPGSLIQQNHGESINGHGILVWDIESKSSSHQEIKNDTCFCTLQVKDGQVFGELSQDHDNIYLRLVHSNTTQKELKEIVAGLKAKKNIVEVSLLKKKVEDQSLVSIGSSTKKSNLRVVSEQNKLIESYLSSKKDVTGYEVSMVKQLNEAVNASINQNSDHKSVSWLPKKFEFTNMFSYGADNSIDFSSMQGTYGIFAKNASGKSTLFDSLIYCIFDKCPKTSKAGQVMNNSSDFFKCKLSFEANSKYYVIERFGKKDKNGSVKVDVDFYELEKGEKLSMNGKDRTETNQIIKTVLGSYEDFVLTSLSSQTESSNFIDLGQKDRKDLLSQFLGVGIFEVLHEKINDSYKEANGALKELGSVDFSYEINQTKEEIAFAETELDKKNNDSSKQKKVDTLEKDIERLKSKLVKIPESASKPESVVKAELDQCSGLYNSESERLKELIEKETSLVCLIEDTNKEIDEFDEELIVKSVEEFSRLKNDYNSANNDLNVLKVKVENGQKKLENLDQLEYDPNCSFCMNNVFVKDAIKTKGEIESLKKSLSESEDKVENIRRSMTDLQVFGELKMKLESLRAQLRKQLSDLEYTKSKKAKATSELDSIEKRMQDLKDSLTLIESNKKNIELNSGLNSEIDLLTEELKKARESYVEDQKRIAELSFKKKLLEGKVATLNTSKSRYESMLKKKRIMELYMSCVHRDGIPQSILADVVPELEQETNSIVQQLYDFRIIFQTDEKTVNAFIAYSEDNFWPVELMSGMERFIVSLAIRIALINISSLPKADFLVIDEGFGVLDSENLSLMSSMLDYLKSRFRFVVVVSHIDAMKDMVDRTINVEKSLNKSKVVF